MRPAHAFLLLATALVAVDARAQTEAAKAQALARYQSGVALHERGQEEEAYLQFVQAYSVFPTPPILFDLARTEQLTGRLVHAAGHFRTYVALPEHPRVTPELRAKASEYLAEVNRRLGHIVIEAPAGASVAVDGKEAVVGATVDVDPGPHAVVGRLGQQQASVSVTAASGAVTPAKLAFVGGGVGPIVAPVPGVTPPVGVSPVEPPPSTPEKTRGGVSTAGTTVRWTLTGLAVVGVGMGIGFGADSQSKSDDAQAFRTSHPGPCANMGSPTCAQYQSLQSDQTTAATLAVVGYSVGAAAAVGAVIAWAFWPRTHASTARLTISPSLGPRIAGGQVGVSF